MDIVLLSVLIGIWITVLILAIFAFKRRASIRKQIEKELTNKILDQNFVNEIRNEIHKNIENSVNKSLEDFVNKNEELQNSLRSMTEKSVVNYIDAAHKKLENAYDEHVDKINQITTQAESGVSSKIIDLQQQMDSAVSSVIPRELEKFSAHLENIENEVLPSLIANFENKINSLTNDAQNTQEEISNFSMQYENQVKERVKSLVDEKAVEILSNYLNASLSGLDFGENQDFIIDRLEQNKDKLKSELGA